MEPVQHKERERYYFGARKEIVTFQGFLSSCVDFFRTEKETRSDSHNSQEHFKKQDKRMKA